MALRCMQCSWLNVLPQEAYSLSTKRLAEYMTKRKKKLTEISAQQT